MSESKGKSTTIETFDTFASVWDSKPHALDSVTMSMTALTDTEYFPENKNNMSLLDFGCGTGAVLMDLADQQKDKADKRFSEIVGSDVSSKMIEQFQEKINTRTTNDKELFKAVVTDLTNPSSIVESFGTDTNRFDVIITNHVLHHCELEEIPTILSGLKKLLKPGGVFIIIDLLLTEQSPLFHPKNTYCTCEGFSIENLASMCSTAGFTSSKNKMIEYNREAAPGHGEDHQMAQFPHICMYSTIE